MYLQYICKLAQVSSVSRALDSESKGSGIAPHGWSQNAVDHNCLKGHGVVLRSVPSARKRSQGLYRKEKEAIPGHWFFYLWFHWEKVTVFVRLNGSSSAATTLMGAERLRQVSTSTSVNHPSSIIMRH